MTKGLAEYRAGRFEASVDWWNKCLGRVNIREGDLTDEFLLAMGECKLGRSTDAKRMLAVAVEKMDATVPETPVIGPYENWFILHIIRREAEALILGTPATTPATQRGSSPSQ
jgi:hypothetical protein